MYPHVDFGLSLEPYLVAIGATGCLSVLHDMRARLSVARTPEERETVIEELERDRESIEARAGGDFVWASLIMRNVEARASDIHVEIESCRSSGAPDRAMAHSHSHPRARVP